MTPFFSFCIACAAGLFAMAQAVALASVFDYHFYLMPFGIALIGLFVSLAMVHLPSYASLRGQKLRALPMFSATAMLAMGALYVYHASISAPVFLFLLFALLLAVYISTMSVIVRGNGGSISIAAGGVGLILGHVFIEYLHVDPLAISAIAGFFTAALFAVQFVKRLRVGAYCLILCLGALALFQARYYQVMPSSPGWRLDLGKTSSEKLDRNPINRAWGQAGISEMYSFVSDEGIAWLYTNGSSPALVLTSDLARYDDAWWLQKAPMAMAIHNAVRPRSVVDVGIAPSDVAWRAVQQGGQNVYGVYGSADWSRMPVSGFDSIRKAVVLLQRPALSADKKLGLPVDMIALSSGHEGEEGWISSNRGEQVFLDQENILEYWDALKEDGALVLLARQQPVFLRQFFSVWQALGSRGMSDAQFLDRAWGIAPVDPDVIGSPYHYAVVLTKKAKDEKFAQALRAQVMALPVRYLFGYSITPSAPYDVFYQYDSKKVQGIFTAAISGMTGKQLTLEASSSHRSVPYQFVKDVSPQYKYMLVLSVTALIGIILLPFKKARSLESIRCIRGPSVAVWLASGGSAGLIMAIAAAFLLVYPTSVSQELRVLCLGVVLLMVAATHALSVIENRTPWLLTAASGVVLAACVGSCFAQFGDDVSWLYVGTAGIILFSLGGGLRFMEVLVISNSPVPLVGWWWLAAGAGSAVGVFWAMGLYAILGDLLLLVAGLLLLSTAGIVWWAGYFHSRKPYEPCVAEGSPI